MKMYLFDFCEFKRGGNTYDASLKPRKDSVYIFQKNKIEILRPRFFSFTGGKNNIKSISKRIWNFCSLRIQFLLGQFYVKDSIVFMQYPLYSLDNKDFGVVMRYFKRRNNKLVFLVHDLNSIRYARITNNDELLFKYADYCIFHSQGMIEKCKKLGFTKQTNSLEFFDYLSDKSVDSQNNLRNIKLVFAGNLIKSKFLEELDISLFDNNFQLLLYGNKNDNIRYSDNVMYKGKFNPDDIANIEGNWGLVWDGDSCNTCSGNFGKYLKYNAPFKFSLYLASNRPVIVWKGSAMAEYVDKYNIGITVNSIYEIPTIIKQMTDQQLNEIIYSVNIVSNDVRNGVKLTSAINYIYKFFNEDINNE